jgi:hypothetical protein
MAYYSWYYWSSELCSSSSIPNRVQYFENCTKLLSTCDKVGSYALSCMHEKELISVTWLKLFSEETFPVSETLGLFRMLGDGESPETQ